MTEKKNNEKEEEEKKREEKKQKENYSFYIFGNFRPPASPALLVLLEFYET